MSPNIKDYLISGVQLLTGIRTRAERFIAEERFRDIHGLIDLDPNSKLRVLDLANGALRPQFSLLLEGGHDVYGIDLINEPTFSIKSLAYRFARSLYRMHLNLESSKYVSRLICGNVGDLPFSNDTFDLISSVAAFEHFLDVPRVIKEMCRVLRSGGIAWIRIHPFTCLSGGHNLSFTEIPIRVIPNWIDPWDHLRHRKLPITVPLNEWRIHQFYDAFAQKFEILKAYCALREGEDLLTKEHEELLSSYSRDELTCATYVILVRKS